MQTHVQNGCPYDRTGETSFHWSGAIIDSDYFMTGGREVIVSVGDSSEGYNYPKEQIVRCEVCGNIWHIDYRWPDHPPMVLWAKMVQPEDRPALFERMVGLAYSTYRHNVKTGEKQLGKGCPFDREGVEHISHSGADHAPYTYLTGGREKIISILDDPAVDNRPAVEVVRCTVCGNIWEFRYSWPDRPPQILEAKMIRSKDRKPFFAGFVDELVETYRGNVTRA